MKHIITLEEKIELEKQKKLNKIEIGDNPEYFICVYESVYVRRSETDYWVRVGEYEK